MTEAMKIIYVTMQWPCASETFCSRDVLALREMGHAVNVLALKPSPANAGYLLKSQKSDSVPFCATSFWGYIEGILSALIHPSDFLRFIVEVLREEKSFSHKKSLLLLIPTFFWAAKKIIYQNPDIIHLFWGHYPCGVAEIIKYRLGKRKIVLTQFLGAYDLNMSLSLSKKVSKYADAVFTHAEANVQSLLDMSIPENKLHVVHRGIDIQSMDGALFGQFRQQRDPYRLIFVGRLVKEKGVAYILQATKIIKQIYPSINLEIIGDGPEMGRLQSLAKGLNLSDCVSFRGYLPPLEVYHSLYNSSFFVFPSTSGGERLPNSVKEAMYAGVVPIVSRTNGISELVKDGHDGFIFGEISSEAISRLVLQVMREGEWEEISKNARKTIAENFDVNVSMEQYVKIWSVNAS